LVCGPFSSGILTYSMHFSSSWYICHWYLPQFDFPINTSMWWQVHILKPLIL
jgi:hypothetical protein